MSLLTFDEPTHTYELEGRRAPSVTQVIKRAGLINFDGIPAGTLDAARRRGTICHQAIHFYNEQDLDLDAFRADFPSYAPYVDAWISFCAQRRFTSELNELRVASLNYHVAGTLDCLGWLDGAPVLLDFATGRPSDVAKDLQTAAYHALALEWAEHEPALAGYFERAKGAVRRYAVALRADGTFKLEPYSDPRDARQFFALLTAQQIVDARLRERVQVEGVA